MSGRSGPVGIGIIGAGVISSQYLTNLLKFPDLHVLFVADLDVDRARAQAELYGVPRHGSVGELLANDDLEIVINLTIPAAHAEVSQQIVAAGKHVWSEKPLSLDRESARSLLDAAIARGVRVACAPDTFLGGGLQATQRLLHSGRIGAVVSALAIFQSPGPESWHPNPEFLFDVGAGPLFDVGPYYITALVQQLGPVRKVNGVASTARPTRTIGSGPRAGTVFPVTAPSQHVALLSFESGATAVLVTSFDSEIARTTIEYTGTQGAVQSPDPNQFGGTVIVHTPGSRGPEVIQSEEAGYGRGLGVLDLARSIRSGTPERASGELAFHVLDVMVSVAESAMLGAPVDVLSAAKSPAPLPDGWDPSISTLRGAV